jgi:uncharacterized protein (TIGR02145 family)
MNKLLFFAVSVMAIGLLFSCSSDTPSGGSRGGFVEEEREHYGRMKKQFYDERDGKKYVYVVVGNLTWMAENLNYDPGKAGTSACYDNQAIYCKLYGRLYDWSTAMKACPKGWHLPTQMEWEISLGNDAKKLKAKSGWDGNDGTDDYGFSALPGGSGDSDGSFYNGGYGGYWWSASEDEDNSGHAYGRGMYYVSDDARWYGSSKSILQSVRCLQD